ncbi:MAG: (2Fe-2S) ferredoxin domain-containing protein [Myxococcales bacterium]|nr:(2Fe-2S) ferredoxin domain-containing protein [Myxococcales bacterium]
MKQPGHLVFVCQNLRGNEDPRGSCMRRGSKEVLDLLKRRRAELGLKEELRVMGATCLGACESGIVTLVVDEGGATFYGRVDGASAEAILQEHVLGEGPGVALARHRLRPDDLLDLSALEGPGEGEGQGEDEPDNQGAD